MSRSFPTSAGSERPNLLLDERAAHLRRFAGWVVSLLFAGSVLNYMDRAVLGVVMPQIRRDLSLTNADYALAVEAFLALYLVFYILGGRIADWLGCRRAFPLNVIFWSVASALHALSRGLVSLCTFRGLLGTAEGSFYPTAMRGAAEWFPQESRAKAVGILICGIGVGTLLASPVAASITLRWGWRAAFFLTGVLGLMLIPPWLFLHRRIRQTLGNPDPAPGYLEGGESSSAELEDASFGEVLRRRKYWLVLAARATTDAVWYFYLFWLPGYFQEVRGFTLSMVGRLAWIPFLAGDAGALCGGWTSSALIRRGLGVDRSRKLVLLVSILIAIFGTAAYYVPSRFVALAVASVGLFGYLSWSSNLHTVITEITPRQCMAVLYGMTGAAGTLMGIISQPLVGHMVDRSGYQAAFVGAGVIFVLGAGLLLGAGKIERIRSLSRDER